MEFTYQIKEIANQLTRLGHEVIIPKTAEIILNGEVTLNKLKKKKKAARFQIEQGDIILQGIILKKLKMPMQFLF